MAPKIPKVINCASAKLLELELSDVRAGLELTETEDSWEKIANALLRLNALTVGCTANYPSQLIAACKGFVRPIINSLNSERSRLSGAATELLTTLTTLLRRSFETLIPLFVPTLLSLAGRSNKIFIARAKACLLAIVENCQSPVILPLLRHSVSDKSVTLRLTATDLVMACLNCYNPPDLEVPNRVDDIEAVIRATARDASADVRKSSRKVFEAYKILFPSRVDSFIGPLTPVMRKYLDIKAAPMNQRKPLLLSSSASAPTLPSTDKPVDTILSRSHTLVQHHAKSASTSSTAPMRTERTSRSTKPPSNSTTTSESVPMLPPPLPRVPSSGPVRPPPSMRQAVAAAAPKPSRPLLSRHAFQAASLDISASQPIPHGGAQRPTKTPTPPVPSPILDAPQHVSSNSQASSESSARERTTTGPRRVPKPEPAPLSLSSTAPTPAPIEKVKESVKEKVAFTSSTSSNASAHANPHARSRPPSRLASSTNSKVGEEKEKEKEREGRTRPASRMGEFRPRPASRAESDSHKRSENKVREESQTRPASRMEGEVHPRPASRAERQPLMRPESRAHVKTVRATKKPVEQPAVRQDVQGHAQAPVLSRKEDLKKKKEGSEARPEKEEAKRKDERSEVRRAAKEKKEEMRKREGGDAPRKRKKTKEVLPVQGEKVESGSIEEAKASSDNELPVPMESEGRVDKVVPPASEPQMSAPTELQLEELTPSRPTSSENVAVDDVAASATGKVAPSTPIKEESTEEETPKAQKRDEHRPVRPTKSINGGHGGGVKPLSIQKESSGQKASRNGEALSPSNDENGCFSEYEEENAYIAAPDIPLPPSPPFNAYGPTEFMTPAPLRQAVAAQKYQIPATPISKLLDKIQHGFDSDFSVIGEESLSEGDITLPCIPPQLFPGSGEMGLGVVVEKENEEGGECLDFVDTRRRKHKPGHGKECKGVVEERYPLTPRIENR